MSREARLRQLHDDLTVHTGWQTAALALLVLTAGSPAVQMAGFGDWLPNLGLGGWLPVAAAGGAVAGAIYHPGFRYWSVGAPCGALVGVGVLLATYYYCQWLDRVSNVDVAVALLVGCLPGLALYYLVLRSLTLAGPDDEPPATVPPMDSHGDSLRQ